MAWATHEVDAKLARERADRQKVKDFLAPLAEIKFDAWCDRPDHPGCGCVYCVARKAIAMLNPPTSLPASGG